MKGRAWYREAILKYELVHAAERVGLLVRASPMYVSTYMYYVLCIRRGFVVILPVIPGGDGCGAATGQTSRTTGCRIAAAQSSARLRPCETGKLP